MASAIAVDESRLWHPDFKVAAQYVMSPPIRGKEHGAAIKKALAGGALQVGVAGVGWGGCVSVGGVWGSLAVGGASRSGCPLGRVGVAR